MAIQAETCSIKHYKTGKIELWLTVLFINLIYNRYEFY